MTVARRLGCLSGILGLIVLTSALSEGQESFTNQDCLDCHSDEDLTREGPKGEELSVFVDESVLQQTVHGDLSCTDCHEGIRELPHEDDLPPVHCGDCHVDQADVLATSIHGSDIARGKVDCQSCHGGPHAIFNPKDSRSPLYPLNVYRTCGSCHFEKKPPATGEAATLSFERYQDDIHGYGIVRDGLIVSATCVSCHGSHDILASRDPQASISKDHVVATCGTCHVGIARDFAEGSHGMALQAKDPRAPTCVICHQPHRIRRVEAAQVVEINRNCGECHNSREKSYTETYHGQASGLGYTKVASCSDCHRAHLVLPASDTRSSINPDHRVATCARCHSGANPSFAAYLVHVDYAHLQDQPILNAVSRAMQGLLWGVFGFFGLHSLLWLRRSMSERKNNKPPPVSKGKGGVDPPVAPATERTNAHFSRLTAGQRVMHGVVIFSFLGLALTGLPLKYSQSGWAAWLVTGLGGIETTAAFHRICAALTFGYFLTHLGQIAYRVLIKREKGLLHGPRSMVPRMKDFADLYGVFRWFAGKGDRPRFDRWTYWEKFDYWAVFWGVAIIGASGLVMAFPLFVTRLLPGWTINVALIVHGEEALLATGFIFSIHFFNTHLKPEKFPMDTVFYTGRVSLDQYRREHPLEVDRLEAEGRLEEHLAPVPTREEFARAYRWGFVALIIGTILLLLIIGAELVGS